MSLLYEYQRQLCGKKKNTQGRWGQVVTYVQGKQARDGKILDAAFRSCGTIFSYIFF